MVKLFRKRNVPTLKAVLNKHIIQSIILSDDSLLALVAVRETDYEVPVGREGGGGSIRYSPR